MERIFKLLVAAAFSLLLSGCYEMQQDVVISDNGTTKLKVIFSVDAAIIPMSSKDKLNDFCTKTVEMKPSKEITTTFEKSTEKGDVVCTITIEGPTDKVFANFLQNDLLSEKDKKEGVLWFKLSSSGDNQRLDLTIDPVPSKPNNNPEAEAMLISATAGRSLSWSVTAPQIIETNGKLSDDGKTVTYSLPLATLVTNHTETYRFHVVYNDKPAGYFGWVSSWFN